MALKPMLTKAPTPMAKKFKEVVNKKDKQTPEQQLWDFWRSLPNGMKHKAGNSQTKKRTLNIIKLIMSGQLGTDILPLDSAWLRKKNIRLGVAKRHWPLLALRTVFADMNASIGPGGPEWLQALGKRPLHQLLYDPLNQRSWFLVFYQEGEIKHAEVIERRIMRPFSPEMVGVLKELTEIVATVKGDNTYLSPVERSTLRQIARDIGDIYEEIPLRDCKNFRREFGTVTRFVKAYKDHVLSKVLGRDSVHAWQLGVKCSLWQEFYDEVIGFCGRGEKEILQVVIKSYRDRQNEGNK
jgi:hypothetical protein